MTRSENLGRLEPAARRARLQELGDLVDQRVSMVLAPYRGSGRTELVVTYRGWAIPTFGTTSDLVIVQKDGYVAKAYSSSRVVSIERYADDQDHEGDGA